MSKERIARLHDLLERVQTRAAAPRGNGASHAAPVAYAQAAVAPAYVEPEPEPVEAMSAAPVTPPMEAAEAMEAATADAADMSPSVEASYDVETDADVEISTETVEVDIDIDEPMPMESGAQPVAQQTMPPEDLEEEPEELPMATQPSVRPPIHSEVQETEELTQTAAPANEIEEPTPSSSRRPIAGEEPAAEAYEEESAPRHTPPPESGKQVAAAPSAHPPSRKPSVPPPSLEGHTLIGGWREPGLGVPAGAPQMGSLPGVRVPPPPGMGTEPPPATIANAPQASGTRLTADVTRPELVAGDANVADFQGAAPIPKPTTLGELLDLTLGL